MSGREREGVGGREGENGWENEEDRGRGGRLNIHAIDATIV